MRAKYFGKPPCVPDEEVRRVKAGRNERTIRLACTKCIYNDVLYRNPPLARALSRHLPDSIVLLPLDFRSPLARPTGKASRPARRRAVGIYSPLKSFTFYLSPGEARVVRGNFRGNCAVPAFLTPWVERCSRWRQCKKTGSKILPTSHAGEKREGEGRAGRSEELAVNRAS